MSERASRRRASTALDDYLEACRLRVDEALLRYLPDADTCAPRLRDAMRYSLEAGGKRLRPVLTLAAAEAVTGNTALADDLALPSACALEYVHTYSLIHDDLPSMDNDTLRRGRPTSHVVFGEALAILAGDALLTEAFRIVATEPAAPPPGVALDELDRRRVRASARLATAAGALGMVGGQVLDLEAERGEAPLLAARAHSPEERSALYARLRGIHASKTGALIRAAATMGALMAGASASAIGAIDAYAAELGLAFQIVDDILDVEGDAATLGKTVGKDAAAGKLTYPALFGLAESHRLAREAVERATSSLRGHGIDGHLPDIAQWVLTRTK